MENTLRIIESENVIVYKDFCYSAEVINECKKFFDKCKMKRIIAGKFEDDEWICYSGVKHFGLNFKIDNMAYMNHIGKLFGISVGTMQLMIKCYVCYCTGEYIFRTIAREVVNLLKRFICEYQEGGLALTNAEIYRIEDFLAFINTPDELISEVSSNIKKIKSKKRSVRKLSNLINYLVIENEINDMFNRGLNDDEFIKYFPIYFWVNITFILPLRATEMLVTPYDCVDTYENEIIFRVRRSKLKGGKNRVYYDVAKDYDIFTYHLNNIINRQVFENIEYYKALTKEHSRRFLFDYGEVFSNHMMSLAGFNNLIRVFIDEKIIGNPKYEFARNVCGLEEFDYVTAGDSRPIAMANLFFQDAGADICRQLANHMNITTSEGYYTNVSETLYYSSIMKMQKKINKDYLEETYQVNEMVITDKYNCSNPKRLNDDKNIDDCKGHYQDCFGCKYYFPTEEEIQKHLKERKSKFIENVKVMQNVLKSTNKIKGKDVDMDELFLKVHSASARYKESTDLKAEKEANEWLEQRNLQMISC